MRALHMAADPAYDPTEFQEVLRAWMERNDYSQMSASHVIGVSQGIINRWLKPRGDPYLVQPDVGALEKFAAVKNLGVDIMQLKRMTNRLSPADLAVLTKLTPNGPPDHDLEGLVKDIRESWSQIEPDERFHRATVTRALWDVHHGRGRGAQRRRQSPPESPADSGSRTVLMVA